MSTALAIYDEMNTPSIAEVMFKSGLFSDTKSLAQAVVKVIAGRELGLGPVAAMRGIDIISGKVALSASLTAALVKQTGRYTYYVVEHDENVCRIEFHERDPLTGGWSPIGTSSFTMDMAKRAGLVSKGVWTQYPEAMLWARAMTQGAGWFCPDATEGRFYTAEELGADEYDEGSGSVEAEVAGRSAEPSSGTKAASTRPTATARPADPEHRSEADPGDPHGTATAEPGDPVASEQRSDTDGEPRSAGVAPTSASDESGSEEVDTLANGEGANGSATSDPDATITSAQLREAFGGALAVAQATHKLFPGKTVHDLTQNQRRQLMETRP